MTGRTFLILLAILFVAGCRRGEEDRERVAEPVGEGLAVPPSASAPRRTLPGEGPDTVASSERGPAVRDVPGPDETVGPVPPPSLEVGVIVNLYGGYYRELFHEVGSDVRNDVDPRLVQDAKHRTALDFGFVQAGAWNQMVRQLTPAQRSDLAARVAAANRDLAIELHGRPPTPR